MIEKVEEEEKLITELGKDFCNLCIQKNINNGVYFLTLSSLMISKLAECVVDMNLDPEKTFNQIIHDMKCAFEIAIENHKHK